MTTSTERIKAYRKSLALRCRQLRLILWALAGAAVFVGCFNFMLMGTFDPRGNALYKLFTMLYSLLCCGGVPLSLVLFSELHNRAEADSTFSLPLSSAERFIAKLWLIAEYHLLPVLAASAVVGLSAALFCGTHDWVRGLEFRFLIVMISQALFADSACFLFIGFCGSLLCCIYVPIVAVTLLSLMPMAIYGGFLLFAGLQVPGSTDLVDNLGVIDLIRALLGDDYIQQNTSTTPVLVIIDLTAAAVFFLLALAVYCRRTALQTGKPFASKWFYIAFFALIICTAFAYGARNQSLFEAILFSLFAGLLVSVTRHGKKSYGVHELCYMLVECCICMAAFTCLLFVVFITYGFGAKEIPPDNYVDSNSQIRFYTSTSEQLIDYSTETFWYIDTDEIKRSGRSEQCAKDIFEVMQQYRAIKPYHTAGNFFKFLSLDQEETTPQVSSTKVVHLFLEAVSYDDYSNAYFNIHVIVEKDSMTEIRAALEERGVPVKDVIIDE